MEKGFDTVVCPWDNPENIRSLSSDVKKLGAYGIILTTWHHLTEFMSHATLWSDCVWGESRQMPHHSWTESACILRRVYDTEGDFLSSGWNLNEVPQ